MTDSKVRSRCQSLAVLRRRAASGFRCLVGSEDLLSGTCPATLPGESLTAELASNRAALHEVTCGLLRQVPCIEGETVSSGSAPAQRVQSSSMEPGVGCWSAETRSLEGCSRETFPQHSRVIHS
jgi:hypothetical protein